MKAPLVLLTLAALANGSASAQTSPAAQAADRQAVSFEWDSFETHRIGERAWFRDPTRRWLVEELYIELVVDASGAVIYAGRRDNGGRADERIPAAYWEPAIAAARKLRFRPFERDGRPVSAHGYARVMVLPAERVPGQHLPFPDVRREDVAFQLVRRGPYQSYAVSVFGDGRVVVEGGFLRDKPHRYSIPVEQVDALIAQFRAADFWSLDERYELEGATDVPTVTLTFIAGNATRSVVDYDGLFVGMPWAVIDLQNAIEDVADADRWITGNANTVAALRAEGFDFKSKQAGYVLVSLIEDAPDAVIFDFLKQGIDLDVDSVGMGCVTCRPGKTLRAAAVEWAEARRRRPLAERLRTY